MTISFVEVSGAHTSTGLSTPRKTLTLSRHQNEWALRESFRRGTINETGVKSWGEIMAVDNSILELQRARIRKAFLWLNPKYVYTRESWVIREKNYTGTCDWIERKLEFRQFMQSTESGNLWIRGIAGCGKTILAKALHEFFIRNAPQTPPARAIPMHKRLGEVAVSDDGLPSRLEWDRLFEKETSFIHIAVGSFLHERRTPDAVLAEIITKLCPDDKALMEMVLNRMDRSNNHIASWKELKSLFIHAGEKRGIVVVIDGIERIENCQWLPLIEAFTEFRHSPRQGTAKIILCSTSILEVAQRFHRDLDFEMNTETIYGDLHILTDRYVERILRHHGIDSGNDVLKERIRRLFEQGPPADCLWKDCLQEYLSHNSNATELEEIFKDPPRTAEEIYFRILVKLEDLDASWKALAYQTLALLIAAKRPYDLEELLIALAVEPGRGELRPRKLLTAPRRVLTSLLGPMIRFRTRIVAGGIGSTETRTISLRHETVYEFLLQQRPGLCFPLRLEECHLLTAKKCIAYLSLDRFSCSKGIPYPRGRGWQNDSDPEDIYLRYAVPFLWDHIFESGDLGIESRELLPALEVFLTSPQILSWMDFIHVNTGCERIEFSRRLHLNIEGLDEWHYGLGDRLARWVRNPKLQENGEIVGVVKRWRAELLSVVNRAVEADEETLYEIAIVRPNVYGGYGDLDEPMSRMNSIRSSGSGTPRANGTYFPSLVTMQRPRESTRVSTAPSYYPPSSPGSPATPSPRRIAFDYDELESDDEEAAPNPPATTNRRMTRSTAALSRLIVRKPVPGTTNECCSVRGSIRSPIHSEIQEQFATMSSTTLAPYMAPVPSVKKRVTRMRETRIPSGIPEAVAEEEDEESEDSDEEEQREIYELESPATGMGLRSELSGPPSVVSSNRTSVSSANSQGSSGLESAQSNCRKSMAEMSMLRKSQIIEPGPGQALNRNSTVQTPLPQNTPKIPPVHVVSPQSTTRTHLPLLLQAGVVSPTLPHPPLPHFHTYTAGMLPQMTPLQFKQSQPLPPPPPLQFQKTNLGSPAQTPGLATPQPLHFTKPQPFPGPPPPPQAPKSPPKIGATMSGPPSPTNPFPEIDEIKMLEEGIAAASAADTGSDDDSMDSDIGSPLQSPATICEVQRQQLQLHSPLPLQIRQHTPSNVQTRRDSATVGSAAVSPPPPPPQTPLPPLPTSATPPKVPKKVTLPSLTSTPRPDSGLTAAALSNPKKLSVTIVSPTSTSSPRSSKRNTSTYQPSPPPPLPPLPATITSLSPTPTSLASTSLPPQPPPLMSPRKPSTDSLASLASQNSNASSEISTGSKADSGTSMGSRKSTLSAGFGSLKGAGKRLKGSVRESFRNFGGNGGGKDNGALGGEVKGMDYAAAPAGLNVPRYGGNGNLAQGGHMGDVAGQEGSAAAGQKMVGIAVAR